MRKHKTYRVSFSVTDHYFQEVRAVSPQAAIRKAQRLYDQHYEQAFEFDISAGGLNGDWQADEVSS